MACWFLTRREKPLVIWVNTGKAYPETLAIIEMVRKESEFLEVRSDRDLQNSINGIPSDIVPIDSTLYGRQFVKSQGIVVQSYLQCCYENISRPLHEAAKKAGVTELIRGQRIDESHVAPCRNGEVVDGIVYRHPIENWTKDEVLAYLATKMDVPEHYALEHSSLDCYDCTAFLEHSKDRFLWTKIRHPVLAEEHRIRLESLREAIAPSMAALNWMS